MKKTVRNLSVEVDIVNPSTGEMFKINGTKTEYNKYYSIKKLTSRINTVNLLNTIAQVASSKTDVKILNYLLDDADRYNEIRLNISNTAKELEVSRVKLTVLLKKCVDTSFFYKVDRGIYFVNPFIWVGRRCNSNSMIEEVQHRWSELVGSP